MKFSLVLSLALASTPVALAKCKDSAAKFKVKKQIVDCKWVGENKEERCAFVTAPAYGSYAVKTHCQKTCEVAGEVCEPVDSDMHFEVELMKLNPETGKDEKIKKFKRCETWMAKGNCETKCKKKVVKDTCSASCEACKPADKEPKVKEEKEAPAAKEAPAPVRR